MFRSRLAAGISSLWRTCTLSTVLKTATGASLSLKVFITFQVTIVPSYQSYGDNLSLLRNKDDLRFFLLQFFFTFFNLKDFLSHKYICKMYKLQNWRFKIKVWVIDLLTDRHTDKVIHIGASLQKKMIEATTEFRQSYSIIAKFCLYRHISFTCNFLRVLV